MTPSGKDRREGMGRSAGELIQITCGWRHTTFCRWLADLICFLTTNGFQWVEKYTRYLISLKLGTFVCILCITVPNNYDIKESIIQNIAVTSWGGDAHNLSYSSSPFLPLILSPRSISFWVSRERNKLHSPLDHEPRGVLRSMLGKKENNKNCISNTLA